MEDVETPIFQILEKTRKLFLLEGIWHLIILFLE